MTDRLEELVGTLLYEGYALYPYTPGTAKNATPTPFGIVYPPAYADGGRSTVRPPAARVPLRAGCDARAPRCASWSRSPTAAHRPPSAGSPSARCRWGSPRPCTCAAVRPARLRPGAAQRRAAGRRPVPRHALRPQQHGARHGARGRAEALHASLLSTHPVLRLEAGRFVVAAGRPVPSVRPSPPARASTRSRCWRPRPTTCCSVRRSCCPTIPSSRPRAAATCSTAPRSRRRCCSTSSRSATASGTRSPRQDPAVRAMIERAAAATPDDILALHGRLVLTDPAIEERP